RLAGVGVKGRDVAIILRVIVTARQSGQHLAAHHHDAGGVGVVGGAQGLLPHDRAGARIQGVDLGRGGRDIEFVVINRQAAGAAMAASLPKPMMASLLVPPAARGAAIASATILPVAMVEIFTSLALVSGVVPGLAPLAQSR